MNKSKLQEKDYEFVRDVLKTTASVDYLYQKLCELENLGLRESEEYKKNSEYLEIALEVEQNHYRNKVFTLSQLLLLMEYCQKEFPAEEILSDIDFLIGHNYQTRILKRITNSLINKMLPSTTELKEILPSEILSIMEYLDKKNIDEKTRQNFKFGKGLHDLFENDIFNTFLSQLEHYANDQNHQEMRSKLIEAKYNLAFINHDIEVNMLATNFQTWDFLYMRSKIAAQSMGINLQIHDFLQKLKASEKAIMQIHEILNVSDSDYMNKDVSLTVLLRTLYMKSAFLYMDSEQLIELNDHFHEYISSDEYISIHRHDYKSENTIAQAFREIDNEKSQYKIICLGTMPTN